MKPILFCLFILSGFGSFAQLTIVQPQLYYFSKRQLEDSDWIKVGEKILFRQECTTELPPEVPTGIVFFENTYYGKEQFSMAVEFKDTVIVAVTYYLAADQTDVLTAIGYPEINAHATARKGEWTAVLDEEIVHTVIVGDRKKITVVRTANTSVH